MKKLSMLRKNEWTPELLYKEFLEANQLSRRKKAFMKEHYRQAVKTERLVFDQTFYDYLGSSPF